MSEKLEAYFGLPNEVKFCRRCVISNQRPNSCVEFKHTPDSKKETIRIDEDGVCDACRLAERKDKEVNWEKREEELKALLDIYRRDDGQYDILVPGSGGKDSVYASHILKYKYGMHPLTVTWAPHIYTDVGWRNFQRWNKAGFDNILFTPNGKVHQLLTKLAFENLLHPFQPFVLGQKNLAPKIAALYKIPLVMFGKNEAEYGNPMQDAESAKRSYKYYADKDFDNFYLGGVSVKDIVNNYGVDKVDLLPYMPADPDTIQSSGIEVHYLGYYLKWVPQEAYYYAAEKIGFEANPERTEGTYSKYNSLDDRIDGFHYYTTYIKFGIGRTTYDAAQEIRNHHLTREEGVALIHRFDGEFPKKYFKEILEYMDMTEERFWELIDKFRSPHLWEKVDGKWKLRHQVDNIEPEIENEESKQVLVTVKLPTAAELRGIS